MGCLDLRRPTDLRGLARRFPAIALSQVMPESTLGRTALLVIETQDIPENVRNRLEGILAVGAQLFQGLLIIRSIASEPRFHFFVGRETLVRSRCFGLSEGPEKAG